MKSKYSKHFESQTTGDNFMKYMEKSFDNFIVNYDDS